MSNVIGLRHNWYLTISVLAVYLDQRWMTLLLMKIVIFDSNFIK